MARRLTLNICHLYPDLMDTYGDKGNIITLVKRCQWRGIKTSVTNVSIGDSLSTPDFSAKGGPASGWDLFFFGGGQDRQQIIVGRDLQKKSKDLKRAIDQGTVLLSICGGYQLLQNYFKTLDGTVIEGIGLFDAHTLGSTTRMIGNLLVETNPSLQLSLRGSANWRRRSNLNVGDRFAEFTLNKKEILRFAQNDKSEGLAMTELIGFENHSGKTYLGANLQPLGSVVKGYGNNGEDETEGAVYKNAFGCYLHGSLLPKNPHFADYLISKALERRYGKSASWRILKPLDDSMEWQAHNSAIKRTRSSS